MLKNSWFKVKCAIQESYLWGRSIVFGKDDHLKHLKPFNTNSRRYGFKEILKINDFLYWDSVPVFSAHQAACLISGYSPGFYEGDYPPEVEALNADILKYAFEDRYSPLLQMAGDFIHSRRQQRIFAPRLEIGRDLLMEYCLLNSLKPPFLFPEQRDSRTPIEIELSETKTHLAHLREEHDSLKKRASTPYLDPGHHSFAPELGISISAWVAVFDTEKPEIKRGKRSKSLIGEWLNKNHPNLTDNAKDQIKQICNPARDKAGGAPKTDI